MSNIFQLKLKATNGSYAAYDCITEDWDQKLDIPRLLFLSQNYDHLLDCFDDPYRGEWLGELVEMEWWGNDDVVMCRSDEIFDDPEDLEEEYRMRPEHFKKMMRDWGALYKKQVPNIYFIFEDDGSVTVKESLD